MKKHLVLLFHRHLYLPFARFSLFYWIQFSATFGGGKVGEQKGGEVAILSRPSHIFLCFFPSLNLLCLFFSSIGSVFSCSLSLIWPVFFCDPSLLYFSFTSDIFFQPSLIFLSLSSPTFTSSAFCFIFTIQIIIRGSLLFFNLTQFLLWYDLDS